MSGCSVVKKLPVNSGDARDMGLNLGLERFPGERNGIPHQNSCLENPMDRGAWCATVHGVTKLDMTKQLHFKEYFNKVSSSDLIFTLIVTWCYFIKEHNIRTVESTCALVANDPLSSPTLPTCYMPLTKGRLVPNQ